MHVTRQRAACVLSMRCGRPHAKSGSSKHVSGIPGHSPVFRYNPGNSGMVGKYDKRAITSMNNADAAHFYGDVGVQRC